MIPPSRPAVDPRLLAEEKERLADFPYFERDPSHTEDGVLLSDRIEHYCGSNFRMIEPFEHESLRPAGYDLRVGQHYAIGGRLNSLNYGASLTIRPYQVAVIQTLETLNIPDFLIGRWNIRVALAYEGLLWVGGAQVDPGFRGRLSCPIYNLSTKSVKLDYGQRLAMIDFVTTTPFKNQVSKAFQWWNGKKLVFQQYATELQSGVEDKLNSVRADLQKGLQEADRATESRLKITTDSLTTKFESAHVRMDTFVTLVFTVVAVLFAGLGVVATKGSDEPSFVSSPVWVAAVALYFALRPYLLIRTRTDELETDLSREPVHQKYNWYSQLRLTSLEIAIASIIVIGSLFFHGWHAHVSAKEVQQAKEQATRAINDLNQEKQTREVEIRELRQQSDARADSLQQQIRLLQQNQSKAK